MKEINPDPANPLIRIEYSNNFRKPNLDYNQLKIVHSNSTLHIEAGKLKINNNIIELPFADQNLLIVQATSNAINIKGNNKFIANNLRNLMNILKILGEGFNVIFDGIRIFIKLNGVFINKVRGLCGTLNYKYQDDFLAPNNMIESSVLSFSEFYKTYSNSITPPQTSPCENTDVKNLKFI